MSIVKSFSVGNGDMFYISHGSSNFSIIDCSLPDERREEIIDEIKAKKACKGVSRFISTHPDQDHISGLIALDDEIEIVNFYCVKNEAKKSDPSKDFFRYCDLRDSDKAFFLSEDCSRKWMNQSCSERGSAGLFIHWPDVRNEHYKKALKDARDKKSPNNISIMLRYSWGNGVDMLWMGDLETDFMAKIEDDVTLPETDILFAPHHGRKSGKVPNSWLEKMDPSIIIVGEAECAHLDYYDGHNTITQNSAGDITFDCKDGEVDVYVSNESYSVDFLEDKSRSEFDHYLGTLSV